MRRYWNRPLGSKLILLLSLVFLLEMIAPWQRVCAVTSGGDDPRVCGWRTGYEGSNFGLYAALFAAAILLWELLPVLIPRLGMRGWPTALVPAALAVALVFCTLLKLVKDNEFQTIWAWVGLGIAVAILVTALMRVRHRWKLARGRGEPEPEREPPRAEAPSVGGSST